LIIAIETAVIGVLLKSRDVGELLKFTGNGELKFWAIQGAYFGSFLVVVTLGMLLIFLLFYAGFPLASSLMKKRGYRYEERIELLDRFLEEQIRETEEARRLKQEAERKLRELQKKEQMLKTMEIEYQRLLREVHYRLEKERGRGIILKIAGLNGRRNGLVRSSSA